MKYFDEEIIKKLSAQDMECYRREIRELNRQLRAELGHRKRYCAYCGEPLGVSDYGFRYCSPWHRYLGSHKSKETLSRVQFERSRALRRIKTVKKATASDTSSSGSSNRQGAEAIQATLRDLRIKKILNEYRSITGESLSTSMRANRH